MKKIFVFLIINALILAFSACSDDGPADTSDPVSDVSGDDTSAPKDSSSATDAPVTDTEAPPPATETDPPATETDPPVDILMLLPPIDGLTYKEGNTISIDNMEFESVDFELIDGTVISENRPNKKIELFLDALTEMFRDELNSDWISDAVLSEKMKGILDYIEIGDARLKVEFCLCGRLHSTEKSVTYKVKEIEVFGKTYPVDVHTHINDFEAIRVSDFFATTDINNRFYTLHFDGGERYIEASTCTVDTYFGYIYDLYEEDGKLMYERLTSKFQPNMFSWTYQIGLFGACVARDELYSEVGEIKLEEGKIKLVPTKTLTLEEAVDIEAEYALWCEHYKDGSYDLTLDEHLAENAKKYPKAK